MACEGMIHSARFLKDKAIVTAFAVFIAYLFFLQGVMGGLSHGAMVASGGYPYPVLCSSVGTVAAPLPGDDGDATAKQVDCLCTALCRFSASLSAAVIGGSEGWVFPFNNLILAYAPDAREFQSSALRLFIGEPRAPPFFS